MIDSNADERLVEPVGSFGRAVQLDAPPSEIDLAETSGVSGLQRIEFPSP